MVHNHNRDRELQAGWFTAERRGRAWGVIALAATAVWCGSGFAANNGSISRLFQGLSGDQAVAGVRIVNLATGEVIYRQNETAPLIPASNQKLLIAAAVIDQLPADYEYRTILGRLGDDLVVVGAGDPATGDPELAAQAGRTVAAMFDDWARALSKAGMTHISGSLIYDDTVFDQQFTHPNWSANDLLKWYGAPVGGLNLNDNCIDLTVWPSGKEVAFSMVPENGWITVENRAKPGGKGKAAPVINRSGDEPRLVLSGRCTAKGTLAPITAPDPGSLFASACRVALAKAGIQIDGRMVRSRVRTPDGNLPPGFQIIAETRTPIAACLQRMLKNSQNMFAEALLKTLGYEYQKRHRLDAQGSWDSGRAAMNELAERLGIPADQMAVDDGSGLSRKNTVSALAMSRALEFIYKHPQGQLVIDNLAVGGVDGTLSRRMKDTDGRVKAKTGYIRGVRTLSGYVESKGGQWLSFVVLFNYERGGTSTYNRIHDQLCRELVNWTEPSQ